MEQINIAIVDDHQLFREGFSALLTSKPEFNICFTAENGIICLHRMEDSKMPDLIFLDLDMPEMDGIETMKALQKNYPDVKVIILSMHQDTSLILHLIEIGANSYILKNSSIQEISTAVTEVITNGYYYDKFVVAIKREGIIVKNRKPVSLNRTTELTTRELDVLNLICKEFTASEIAEKLFLSQRTVEGYKKNLLEKTNSKNTTGMILYCLKNKIINLEEL